MPARPKPATVSEYISAAPKATQAKLRQMRAATKASAPDATEGLKWGMPALTGKRVLVTYAAHKEHIGFYPTPSAVKAFAKELAGFPTRSGSIQFPLSKPLPLALVRKITRFRVNESQEKDAKWRS